MTKNNESWDGYFKSPMPDPIWSEDIQATKILADTTVVFPKAPKQTQYVHDDLMTLNPRIAFLSAIGQDIYNDNFYISESISEDFQLTSRACEIEKFLRDSDFKIIKVDSMDDNIKTIEFKVGEKKYRIDIREV